MCGFDTSEMLLELQNVMKVQAFPYIHILSATNTCVDILFLIKNHSVLKEMVACIYTYACMNVTWSVLLVSYRRVK